MTRIGPRQETAHWAPGQGPWRRRPAAGRLGRAFVPVASPADPPIGVDAAHASSPCPVRPAPTWHSERGTVGVLFAGRPEICSCCSEDYCPRTALGIRASGLAPNPTPTSPTSQAPTMPGPCRGWPAISRSIQVNRSTSSNRIRCWLWWPLGPLGHGTDPRPSRAARPAPPAIAWGLRCGPRPPSDLRLSLQHRIINGGRPGLPASPACP
jgi:hypothetical protein